MLARMADKILFMLVECGSYGKMRAELSAFDATGKSKPFVDKINAQLARLPPAMLKADALAAAMKVLDQYGFGPRGSAGLFEDPRPAQRELAEKSVRNAIARRSAPSVT